MIKTKFTLLAFSALLLLVCHAPSSEALEVTILKGSDINPYNEAVEGFKTACDCNTNEFVLSEMEKGNITKSLLESKPDMILAVGVDALKQVKEIKNLPVVYTMVPDSSLLNEGSENISGVVMSFQPERYLSTMVNMFPDARRIGVVYNPENTETYVKEALQEAHSQGVELIAEKASRPGQVPAIIDGMKDRIDLLWMLPDATVINSATINYILLFSFQNKVPIVTFSKKYVEMGAIASLNILPFDLGAQAGEIAAKLYSEKGRRIPITAYARKLTLAINQKVAKKLGIKLRVKTVDRVEYVN